MSDEPYVDPADIGAEDRPVDDELFDDELDDLPIEADPADAVDQRRIVPLDDDREVLEGDALVDDSDGFGGYDQ